MVLVKWMNDIDKCLKRLHDRFAWRFWAVAVSHSAKPHRQDEPISIAICVWITRLCSCRAVGRSINPGGRGVASSNPRAFDGEVLASILAKILRGGSLTPGSDGSVVAGCCGTCNFNLFQARRTRRGRAGDRPPYFWQIHFPYSNKESKLRPPHYCSPTQIFRPSYGPVVQYCSSTKKKTQVVTFTLTWVLGTRGCGLAAGIAEGARAFSNRMKYLPLYYSEPKAKLFMDQELPG